MKTPLEGMGLTALEKGSCSVQGLFFSSIFRPGLPQPGSVVGFKVAVASMLGKDVCPLLHLSGKQLPADEVAGWWWPAEDA